jgi:hypothetical protein
VQQQKRKAVAPSEGVTVSEFRRLMKSHAPKSNQGWALSYREGFDYLEQCVERGLMTRIDCNGSRRYVPTPRLIDVLEALQ